MKKLFALLACLATVVALRAIPAHPRPVNVAQPDGDSLTVTLVGDEFYHYYTTADGYTVLRTQAGGWEYARRDGQQLAATGVLAHNPERRTAGEQALTATLTRHLTARDQVAAGRQARAARDRQGSKPRREPVVDYSSFRGLIVLINFNDKRFLMNQPNAFYNDMVNTRDYTGFYSGTGGLSRFNRCTGSMRDYFYDQSMGQFDPQFDVVGPVDVPFSCRDCGERYGEVFKAALDSIDAEVDFTRYDSDSNGEVDMVFFMVAGYAASYSGNDQAYLWPHMSYLYGIDAETHRWYPLVYDEMYMGRYASSTEIYGWESYNMTGPAGIGTMCHEFSHVLGLPDLYDTDYEEGGGQSNHPGDWDVMASGSSASQGRTPVGYSLWERSELGWTVPEVLDRGNYRLEELSKSNKGYVLPTPVDGETFYFENRQKTKWDSALPGHGLVVARVDYTESRPWDWNEVNANPAHNYYELVRASGGAEGAAFPGPAQVTTLNAVTLPPLATWNGTPCTLGLNDIAEDAAGVITFSTAMLDNLNSMVEDFEAMPAISGQKITDIKGVFATWDFVQATVAPDTHFGSTQECQLAMPASLTMTTDIDADFYKVTLDADNPSGQEAKVQLSYSLDQGATWKNVDNPLVVPGTSTAQLAWRMQIKQPVRFRLIRNAGNRALPLYVDNLTIHFVGDQRAVDIPVRGDIDGNGVVDVDDLNIIINIMLNKNQEPGFAPRADIDGSGVVDVDDLNIVINIMLHRDV
ncbi:MAG: M6 family metalloprotease domain-containing protein [Muribaculaceae bacterium]|nr:M6 family metalloprotease domain-containing protein [Muribaculaceae bacterium]